MMRYVCVVIVVFGIGCAEIEMERFVIGDACSVGDDVCVPKFDMGGEVEDGGVVIIGLDLVDGVDMFLLSDDISG